MESKPELKTQRGEDFVIYGERGQCRSAHTIRMACFWCPNGAEKPIHHRELAHGVQLVNLWRLN